jgi:hypothetical protein
MCLASFWIVAARCAEVFLLLLHFPRRSVIPAGLWQPPKSGALPFNLSLRMAYTSAKVILHVAVLSVSTSGFLFGKVAILSPSSNVHVDVMNHVDSSLDSHAQSFCSVSTVVFYFAFAIVQPLPLSSLPPVATASLHEHRMLVVPTLNYFSFFPVVSLHSPVLNCLLCGGRCHGCSP